MILDVKIRDKKLEYYIKTEIAMYQYYHQVKYINISILQVRKYYPQLKVD